MPTSDEFKAGALGGGFAALLSLLGPLALFAPAAIIVVGLVASVRAAVLAAISLSALVLIIFGPLAGALTAAFMGVPAVVMAQARVASQDTASQPIVRLAITSVLLWMVLGGVAISMYGGVTPVAEAVVDRFLQTVPAENRPTAPETSSTVDGEQSLDRSGSSDTTGLSPVDRAQFITNVSLFGLAMASALWTALVLGNLWLGDATARRFQHTARDRPPLHDGAVPAWMALVLAIGVVALFLPAPLGPIAPAVVAPLAVIYMLVGAQLLIGVRGSTPPLWLRAAFVAALLVAVALAPALVLPALLIAGLFEPLITPLISGRSPTGPPPTQ